MVHDGAEQQPAALAPTFPSLGYCPKLLRVTRPRSDARGSSLFPSLVLHACNSGLAACMEMAGDRVVPCLAARPRPAQTPTPWSRSLHPSFCSGPPRQPARRPCSMQGTQQARPRREPLAHKRHYSYETNGAGPSASVGTRVQLFGQISPKFQCFFRFR